MLGKNSSLPKAKEFIYLVRICGLHKLEVYNSKGITNDCKTRFFAAQLRFASLAANEFVGDATEIRG